MLSSKEKKRLYDIEYRRKNKEKLKRIKKAYYEKNKAEIYEKKRSRVDDDFRARHAAYCRQPEYAERKRKYDRVHRALKKCGEFWESDLIVAEILKECRSLAPSKNKRLYARINKERIVARNAAKRLEKAISDLTNGAGEEVLQRAWTRETRSYLELFHEKMKPS